MDTSVDYLLSGQTPQDCSLRSTKLIKRFRELAHFDAEDQETVIKLIDAMIVKNKVKGNKVKITFAKKEEEKTLQHGIWYDFIKSAAGSSSKDGPLKCLSSMR